MDPPFKFTVLSSLLKVKREAHFHLTQIFNEIETMSEEKGQNHQEACTTLSNDFCLLIFVLKRCTTLEHYETLKFSGLGENSAHEI